MVLLRSKQNDKFFDFLDDNRLIFVVLSGRFQNLFWKKERFWLLVVTATMLLIPSARAHCDVSVVSLSKGMNSELRSGWNRSGYVPKKECTSRIMVTVNEEYWQFLVILDHLVRRPPVSVPLFAWPGGAVGTPPPDSPAERGVGGGLYPPLALPPGRLGRGDGGWRGDRGDEVKEERKSGEKIFT